MDTKFLSYKKYFADSIYINFILTKTSRNSPIVHLLNRNWLNTTDKDYSMLGKVHANTSMYVVYFSYNLPNTAGHFNYVLAHSGWLCYILLDFALWFWTSFLIYYHKVHVLTSLFFHTSLSVSNPTRVIWVNEYFIPTYLLTFIYFNYQSEDHNRASGDNKILSLIN